MIWSGNLAYALGLMASDGCLSPDGRHLIFVSKDIEQIHNLQTCLGLEVKIARFLSGRPGSTEHYYRLQWGDVTLYDFLLSIGFTPRKSLTLGALAIPDEHFFDFLRGHFDGDGCFYSYFDPRWKSSFMFYFTIASGSKDFVLWLQELLTRLSGVAGHITSNPSKTFFQLKYAKKESLVLLERMYENPTALHLKRKKLKIARALRIVGLSLPTSRQILPGC